MKFKVTMKDPDTLYDAIYDAVEEELLEIKELDDDERENVSETRRKAIQKICGKWFKYSEYLTVEIDTEAKTATVCDV